LVNVERSGKNLERLYMFRYWRANVPTRLADFFPYNIFARRTKRTHVLDNSIEKKRGTH